MLDKQAFKKYATKHLGLREELLDHHIGEVEGMTRTVIEERPKPFREIDVFSRLIMNRIIFLGSAIDDKVANVVTAQLLFLESVNPEKQITLYINSPGGSVYDGLAIYDTMQYVKSPISTACIGLAASMGAVLLTGGEKRAAGSTASLTYYDPPTTWKSPRTNGRYGNICKANISFGRGFIQNSCGAYRTNF